MSRYIAISFADGNNEIFFQLSTVKNSAWPGRSGAVLLLLGAEDGGSGAVVLVVGVEIEGDADFPRLGRGALFPLNQAHTHGKFAAVREAVAVEIKNTAHEIVHKLLLSLMGEIRYYNYISLSPRLFKY